MNSLFPDICTQNIDAAKTFYTSLFDLEVLFSIDWYVQLKSPTDDNLQIAFVDLNHESVPKAYQKIAQGVVVTIESEIVDQLYDKANKLKIPIIKALCDEEWGQRHFMVEDPNGLLVDVYKAIEPSESFMKHYT